MEEKEGKEGKEEEDQREDLEVTRSAPTSGASHLPTSPTQQYLLDRAADAAAAVSLNVSLSGPPMHAPARDRGSRAGGRASLPGRAPSGVVTPRFPLPPAGGPFASPPPPPPGGLGLGLGGGGFGDGSVGSIRSSNSRSSIGAHSSSSSSNWNIQEEHEMMWCQCQVTIPTEGGERSGSDASTIQFLFSARPF